MTGGTVPLDSRVGRGESTSSPGMALNEVAGEPGDLAVNRAVMRPYAELVTAALSFVMIIDSPLFLPGRDMAFRYGHQDRPSGADVNWGKDPPCASP